MPEPTPFFRIVLPIPPTDNLLSRHGNGRSFASREYQDWLSAARPLLLEALPGHMPDTSRWWGVELGIHRGVSGDCQNHAKALLDALSGARLSEKGERSSRTGKELAKGTIRHTPLFWDDDRRVRWTRYVLECVNDPEPTVELRLFVVDAPPDRKTEEKGRVKAEAARVRLQKRADAWNAKWPVGTFAHHIDPGCGERVDGSITQTASVVDGELVAGINGVEVALRDLHPRKVRGKKVVP